MSYRTSLRTLLLNQGNYPPIADAEWTDIRGSAPLTVNFDGSLSHDEDPGDSITSWQWEFGDGQQATDEKVTHIYTQPGHYFPKLTVTDQSGVRDTFIAEVTVK